MKIINFLLILIIIISFLSTLFTYKKNYLFLFSPAKYQHIYESSQFAADPLKRKTYISDWDLYAYAGYQYDLGSDPTAINFEHPPLAKYLIGLSILFFGNQNILQIFAGGLFLILFYLFSALMIKNISISLFMVFLISLESLFRQQIAYSMLDIWQADFVLLGLLGLSIYKKNNWGWLLIILAITGISATKFFITGIVFGIFIVTYFIAKKDFISIKHFLFFLPVSLVLYLSVYLPFFKLHNFIQFVDFEYKTIKFFRSYVPEYPPGEVWRMLSDGSWQTWWGNKGIIRTDFFNPLWPVLELNFFFTLLISFKNTFKHLLLPLLWAIIYLVFTSIHLLFPHYLLLALPALYILLGANLLGVFKYVYRHRWV